MMWSVTSTGTVKWALQIFFWSWPAGAKRAETVPRTSAATERLISMTSRFADQLDVNHLTIRDRADSLKITSGFEDGNRALVL